MAKKALLGYGFVYACVNEDNQCGCLMEIRCENESLKTDPQVLAFVKEAASHMLKNDLPYLRRIDVPLEKWREHERIVRSEAQQRTADSSQVIDTVRRNMSEWYEGCCLLEQPYRGEEGKNFGLKEAELSKELGASFEISKATFYSINRA